MDSLCNYTIGTHEPRGSPTTRDPQPVSKSASESIMDFKINIEEVKQVQDDIKAQIQELEICGLECDNCKTQERRLWQLYLDSHEAIVNFRKMALNEIGSTSHASDPPAAIVQARQARRIAVINLLEAKVEKAQAVVDDKQAHLRSMKMRGPKFDQSEINELHVKEWQLIRACWQAHFNLWEEKRAHASENWLAIAHKIETMKKNNVEVTSEIENELIQAKGDLDMAESNYLKSETSKDMALAMEELKRFEQNLSMWDGIC